MALTSVYTDKFNRVGQWSDDGGTLKGNPLQYLIIQESNKSYQRQKNEVGYKRALPFLFNFMHKTWDYCMKFDMNSFFSVYFMAAPSICLSPWIRIDELDKIKISCITIEKSQENHLL